MPIVRAHREGRAVLAVSVYDLEGLMAVATVGARLRSHTIAQVGSSAFTHVPARILASAAVAAARTNPYLSIHLDHCRSLGELRECVALGYNSVMFDGSHLPFEENVAATTRAVAIGHAAGVWVEGELGAIDGDENESRDTAQLPMTDVDEARWFVEATGVDVLAVSVGNVHGLGARPVHLDIEHLARLSAAVRIPLVLHGASGLDVHEVRAAVRAGVAKINVNAEARRGYLDGLRGSLLRDSSDAVTTHLTAARDGMAEVVARLFEALDAPVLASGGRDVR